MPQYELKAKALVNKFEYNLGNGIGKRKRRCLNRGQASRQLHEVAQQVMQMLQKEERGWPRRRVMLTVAGPNPYLARLSSAVSVDAFAHISLLSLPVF